MSVTLHTTHGDLKLELFCESVQKTCENFLGLCASGAYDASPFHRSIPNFIIQGGTPSSTPGKGGSSIWGAPFEDEIRPGLRHNSRGIVSMANKGLGTNASQFFVTYAPAPHLDGKNTVFGKVIGGLETLDMMEAIEVDEKSMPKERIAIARVTIHANPLAG